MGIRTEKIRIILRNRRAFEFFIVWLALTGPNIPARYVVKQAAWYETESEGGTKPVGVATKTTISDFITMVVSARRNAITLFCEGDHFALEG